MPILAFAIALLTCVGCQWTQAVKSAQLLPTILAFRLLPNNWAKETAHAWLLNKHFYALFAKFIWCGLQNAK